MDLKAVVVPECGYVLIAATGRLIVIKAVFERMLRFSGLPRKHFSNAISNRKIICKMVRAW